MVESELVRIEAESRQNDCVERKIRKKIKLLDFVIAQVFICLVVSLVLVGIKLVGSPEPIADVFNSIFNAGQTLA